MYKFLIRPFLFLVNPEAIHHFVFKVLKFGFKIPFFSYFSKKAYSIQNPKLESKVFGLTFPNPVGLAAGFDKDAKLFDELSYLGFGFIEVGTLTPKSQPGNDKPRMFRLKEDSALINRMGFNNEGVYSAVERLKKRKTKIVIGGNIGKNKSTPNIDAIKDYEECLQALYDYVDYFVVNVSSPNTPGLRELQDKEPLKNILFRLKEIAAKKPVVKPILLKIAPDLTTNQLDDIIEIVQATKLDGIVATNTTISRDNLNTSKAEVEAFGNGGLSGKPLHQKAFFVVKYIAEKTNRTIPIIAVGGIHSVNDAQHMLNAGASLVQLYTGFIYEGPGLVKEINSKLIKN